MKNLFVIGFCIGFCSLASAVPRGMYLASPKKIEVVGNQVALTFKLPCTDNKAPNEWAGNLIAVSDDEGDMAVALGVVLAKSSCEAGPMKEFTFKYPLSKTGVKKSDLELSLEDGGTEFVPLDIAK